MLLEIGSRQRSTIDSFFWLRAVSVVVSASRAAGPASHGRGNASVADPKAGSAKKSQDLSALNNAGRATGFAVARLSTFQARSNIRFALPSSSRRVS